MKVELKNLDHLSGLWDRSINAIANHAEAIREHTEAINRLATVLEESRVGGFTLKIRAEELEVTE